MKIQKRRLFNDQEIRVIAQSYIKTHGTVKSVSEIFNVSKSTIYRCITIYIEKIDIDLYIECKKIREWNRIKSKFSKNLWK